MATEEITLEKIPGLLGFKPAVHVKVLGHSILVERTGSGWLARDNCDGGRLGDTPLRAFDSYYSVALSAHTWLTGDHPDHMIHEVLPLLNREMERLAEQVKETIG